MAKETTFADLVPPLGELLVADYYAMIDKVTELAGKLASVEELIPEFECNQHDHPHDAANAIREALGIPRKNYDV